MSCYSDIIKIRAVCGDTTDSHSGYYLEDLPGFDRQILDAILATDDISSTTLGERLIELSWRSVEQDTLTLLAPKLKVGSIIRSGVLGQYQETSSTFTPVAGREYGIVIELWRDADLALLLQNLKLLLAANLVTTLHVYDLLTGQLLTSIPASATANETLILDSFYTLESSSLRRAYFVSFEPTVNAYKVTIDEGGCCGSGLKAYPGYIDTASPKLYSNLKRTSYSPGLVIDYSVRCEYHSWLCRNAQSFALPAFYRLGVAIQDEILYNRINVSSITGLDRDKATEQKAQHFSDYSISLKGVSSGMVIPDTVCFNCNNRTHTRVSI